MKELRNNHVKKIKTIGNESAILDAEEYNGEKVISILRIILFSLLTISTLVEYIFWETSFISFVLPNIICIVISLLLLVKSFYTDNSKKNILHSRYFKFAALFIDITMVSFALWRGILNVNLLFPGTINPQVVYSDLMLIAVILLLLINILRFHTGTACFLGAVAILEIILFNNQMISGSFFYGFSSFFTEENFNNIVIIIMVTSITSFISSRFRRIIIKNIRQEKLSRFLPEMVTNNILSGDNELEVGGTRTRVTILFSDIRNFTSLSERQSPEDTIDFLNAYFNDMVTVLFKYKGSLDKIVGDGLMAYFGVPYSTNNDEEMAVRTAIDMTKKLNDFNQIRILQGKEEIRIGIGIHSGEVIIGNVGCQKRMDFTIIGDAVNTASRIQELTKKTGDTILLSEEVFNRIPESIKCNRVGRARVKGKKQTVNLYRIKEL